MTISQAIVQSALSAASNAATAVRARFMKMQNDGFAQPKSTNGQCEEDELSNRHRVGGKDAVSLSRIEKLKRWAAFRLSRPQNTSNNNESFYSNQKTLEGGSRFGRNFSCYTAPDFGVGFRAKSTASSPSTDDFRSHMISPALTHSASGHLTTDYSEDDLEYKNLLTIIPYHRSQDGEGPSTSELLVYNKLLQLVLNNSPNLTKSLTSYILNCYAPMDKGMPKFAI